MAEPAISCRRGINIVPVFEIVADTTNRSEAEMEEARQYKLLKDMGADLVNGDISCRLTEEQLRPQTSSKERIKKPKRLGGPKLGRATQGSIFRPAMFRTSSR